MNPLDDLVIDYRSFSFKDIQAQDRWEISWTPVFTSLTVIGATSYSGRFRIIGKSCEFQVKFSAATSVASTAGTTYLALPLTALGYAGFGVMTNDTTNIAVGLCHLKVSTSRLYLPSQVASGNVFNLFGKFEV